MPISAPTQPEGPVLYEIKKSFIDALKSNPVISEFKIYESEGYISPKVRLPAISVQRGERIRSDMRDMAAGFRTYQVPMVTTVYTLPTKKGAILPELYRLEEEVQTTIEVADKEGLLHESIHRLEFVSARESTIYDMRQEKIFSNTVRIAYNIIYEVQI